MSDRRRETRPRDDTPPDDSGHWSDMAPRAVLEASPNPIVAVDADARITYANSQARTTFGYDVDELIGRRVEMLLPERVAERHVRHRDTFIAHPSPGRWASASTSPVVARTARSSRSRSASPRSRRADGLQVFATVVDITARKAAESQLLQAQKMEVDRPAGRRHRARLQQHAVRDPRLRRDR